MEPLNQQRLHRERGPSGCVTFPLSQTLFLLHLDLGYAIMCNYEYGKIAQSKSLEQTSIILKLILME